MMRNRDGRLRLIGRFSVTFIHVCFTQAALYLVSSMFVSSSLLTLISVAVVVLLAMAGIGRCCKVVGLRSSAPAFVFMNLIFVWCVYIFEIRRAISCLQDIMFNLGVLMLAIGLYSIMSSDPGFIKHGSGCNNNIVNIPFPDVEVSSERSELVTCGKDQKFSFEERARYCKYCRAHIKGFDHHCPAFGNCIGQGNYRLFIVLLVGFIITEASYIACVSQIMRTSHIFESAGKKDNRIKILATSTMLFSLLQVLWQVVFLTWHLYCICFNIRTDEWINWKKYPAFQLAIQPQKGQPISKMRFTNPYDKGILKNLKEFIKGKGPRKNIRRVHSYSVQSYYYRDNLWTRQKSRHNLYNCVSY